MSLETRQIIVNGKVQGVGFRPHVYRLANQLQVSGFVRNRAGDVEIVAQASVDIVQQFQQLLLTQAPAIAKPYLVSSQRLLNSAIFNQFEIVHSAAQSFADIHLPVDFALCEDCIRELNTPTDQRFHYPFINCTQCGPRYTLIKALPYDRASTTMAGFDLCPDCQIQYQTPSDRRFHAEPIACPVCGPSLSFVPSAQTAEAIIQDNAHSLAQAVAWIKAGQIVAVKGIGGYHLCCDATNATAIARLRQKKNRPDKPLAVMFDERSAATDMAKWVDLTPIELTALHSPERPIVLARKCAHTLAPDNLAPDLNEIGVFLPYSPLHYLLLRQLQRPMVCTSANFSGEPVLTDNDSCQSRLSDIADAFLHHNRPIERPADDSVGRVVANQLRMLRQGRGYAPIEFTLAQALPYPILAVGGHHKNTVALAWDKRMVVSPHIGDLGSLRSLEVFEKTIQDLQQLYQVKVQQLVSDANPTYSSTKWAQLSGLPVHRVAHHHAHASALAGEYPQIERWMMFCWDGVGLGVDNGLWGGEAFLGKPAAWQRVASFMPFRLPGADKVSRQPWRTAASICWHLEKHWEDGAADLVLLKQAWKKGINAPWNSAVGRLFDAASCLLGLVDNTSFEGQGPMLLEAIATGQALVEPITLPLIENEQGIWCSDWRPLFEGMLDQQMAKERRAMQFHLSLANAIVDQAFLMRKSHGNFAIGLTGGVFQNRLLTELAKCLLEAHGFHVYLPKQFPCNDAAISVGQIIEYLYQ